MRCKFIIILVVLISTAYFSAGWPHAACADHAATTTADPNIPVDELALLLTPLTLDEVTAEADAWLALLKAKAHEISNAEVAAKHKQKEIRQTEEAIKAVEKVQETVGKTKTNIASAMSQKDVADTLDKAAEAAGEAKKAIDAATDVTNENAAKEKKKAPAETAVKDMTNLSEKLAEAATDGDSDQKALHEAAEAVKNAANQATQEKIEIKTKILSDINTLRTERTSLIDRVNTVLDEMEKKGGETDAYRKYIIAVSGVRLDVSDTSATWSTIKGWVLSGEGGLRWFQNIIKFVVTVLVFWIIATIVGKIVHKLLGAARNTTVLMQDFISKSTRRGLLLIGVIVGLSALEVNIGPLLTVIGAAGFVVAFALQDTLGNFASGIMILLYRPFDVGDLIDAGGVYGKVDSLNLVSVGIKTLDNKSVIVPNNAVWGSVITNSTDSAERRVDMVFGISYNDDIEKAHKLLEGILEANPLVLETPEPVVRLHELADSSVNFVCRPWVKTDDYWTVYWDVTRAVKETFDANDVSIPFPQRDIHLYQALSSAPKSVSALTQSGESAHQAEDFPDGSGTSD